MSLGARFSIHPKQAIAKFLVDMRHVSERAFRRWNSVLIDAINECPLSPRENAALLKPHPIDDYFFAGVVALQAQAVRRMFPSETAESLMRELAVQVDGVVGRSDSVVSHIVFMALTRMRKARLLGNDRDHDQVIETLLQRIGLDKRKATQHLMTQLLLRQTLGEPLVLASPNWWQSFAEIYAVMRPPRMDPPVRFVTVIDPAATAPATRRRDVTAPPVMARGSALPTQILNGVTIRARSNYLRQ